MKEGRKELEGWLIANFWGEMMKRGECRLGIACIVANGVGELGVYM